MNRASRVNLAIVGAGKVGCTLGRVFIDNGGRVTCVVSRSVTSLKKAGRFLRCKNVSTDVSAIPAETGIIYITAPHGAVEGAARELSHVDHLDFARLTVCHASGMLTAAALTPLKRKGATVFSFHPLQTFPRDFEPKEIVPTVRGIYYGVDGSPEALQSAARFAKALDGKILKVPVAMRPFYHAACVVASNHLTTVLSIVQQMFYILGQKEADFFEVFRPIVSATLKNIEATSPAHALSGPVARGGVETIREHLQHVKQYAPDLSPYFARMTEETAKLALRKGSIDAARFEAMRLLAREFGS